MDKILCSISTRGRYHTTLPMVLTAVINQSRPVDKLIIFDDNDDPKDLRKDPIYSCLFTMMDRKCIAWEWVFAGKKGQHHNHQAANTMEFDWVWRVDDDAIPEANVLEKLASFISPSLGAVGGAVLVPSWEVDTSRSTGKIENIDSEPNVQFAPILRQKAVDHLHCSFLYRAGICDYNRGLSRVAHREETMFSYSLKRKGLDVLVTPGATTWHLKSEQGGIRSEKDPSLWAHDEAIFQNFMSHKDNTVVVLDSGMGDHIVFSHILSEVKNPIVFTCYPDIVPGDSIQKAKDLFGDIESFNIYRKMHQWKWTNSLENAFRKMYL